MCIRDSITAGLSNIHPKIQAMIFVFPLVIIKYTTDSSSFIVAMLVYKIVITLFFKCGIKGRIEFITNIFIGLMEMFCIFFKQIIWCEVSAAAKPPVCEHVFFVV